MFWTVIVLIAVVFVLTYDPKSRTIEKFVAQPTAQTPERDCKHDHLQEIQFGQQQGVECQKNKKTQLGAVIA